MFEFWVKMWKERMMKMQEVVLHKISSQVDERCFSQVIFWSISFDPDLNFGFPYLNIIYVVCVYMFPRSESIEIILSCYWGLL